VPDPLIPKSIDVWICPSCGDSFIDAGEHQPVCWHEGEAVAVARHPYVLAGITDEMVERAALALHGWQTGPDSLPWEREDDFHRDSVRDAARHALSAAFSTSRQTGGTV
jgi:hypothetical protein